MGPFLTLLVFRQWNPSNADTYGTHCKCPDLSEIYKNRTIIVGATKLFSANSPWT